MNANYFRKLYDYHRATNRKIWERSVMSLTDTQYTEEIDYSIGSIRNHIVHMVSVDERWFAGLRQVEVPDFRDPVEYPTRAKIRAEWDIVEVQMQVYLKHLTDAELSQPFPGLDGIARWEILLHVANHGTDHRAQVLAGLHRLGAPTFPQDYAYFTMGIEV